MSIDLPASNRRQFMGTLAGSFSGLALDDLLAREGVLSGTLHHPPKAKQLLTFHPSPHSVLIQAMRAEGGGQLGAVEREALAVDACLHMHLALAEFCFEFCELLAPRVCDDGPAVVFRRYY